MSWLHRIGQLLRPLRRRSFEQDLDEEIQSHLELEIDRHVEAGLSPRQAYQATRRSFGPIAPSKEDSRAVWGWDPLDRLAQDLRFGFRMLRKSPGFTAVAILSLALGIGANTAIFSVVYATLLKPLPYRDSDRLLVAYETFLMPGGRGTGSVSAPNLLDWREQNEVFVEIGGFENGSFNLTGLDEPAVVAGSRVTAEVFPLLGVEPLLGRYITTGDDTAGNDRVVVLSYGLWQERFNADPAIAGKTIGLNGAQYTIAGVMPSPFQFPPRSRSRLWLPLTFSKDQSDARGMHWMRTIAKLKDGVPLDQAQANMQTIAARLAQQYPAAQEDRGVQLQSLAQTVTSGPRAAVLTLFGAVGFVLLIVCANVSNLLLARAAARRREIAVRAALGASRSRLLKQLMVESLLLALAGGLAGLALSHAAIGYLTTMPGSAIPRGGNVGVNGWVLGFCAAVSTLAALVSGLVPALRGSRTDLHSGLKEGSRGSSGAGPRDGFRAVLITAEMALSLVVLIGAGLMWKSFHRLQTVDPGVRPEHVLTMRIPLSPEKYASDPDVRSFYELLVERVGALPGVTQAGLINMLPLDDWGSNGNFQIRGRHEDSVARQPFAEFRVISSHYFQAIGTPLVAGRYFTEHERQGWPGVVIINQTFAKAYWPNESPLGHQIGYASEDTDENWFTIVGVVADAKNAGLRNPTRGEVYASANVGFGHEMNLVVRSTVDPVSLGPAIRAVIHDLDTDQPVYLVRTMEQVIASSIAPERFQTVLFGVFAGLALLLALAGVYGVISYAVTQRTHEMGIRMALGAHRGDVLRLVLGHGLSLALIGTFIGIAVALWLTRFLQSQLFGVEPTDPTTFVGVALLLLATTLVACYIPARRAAKVDPIVALRYE